MKRTKREKKQMKKFVTQGVVALAIITSFTVSAEAKQVVPEASAVSISITSTVSAVGVLAKS
jgi:hypothetical protein